MSFTSSRFCGGPPALQPIYGLRYVGGLVLLPGRSIELAMRVIGVAFAVVFLIASVQRLNDIGCSRWLVAPLVVLVGVVLLPQQLWVRTNFATLSG